MRLLETACLRCPPQPLVPTHMFQGFGGMNDKIAICSGARGLQDYVDLPYDLCGKNLRLPWVPPMGITSEMIYLWHLTTQRGAVLNLLPKCVRVRVRACARACVRACVHGQPHTSTPHSHTHTVPALPKVLPHLPGALIDK